MTATIQIVGMRQRVDTTDALVINTCNNNPDNWQSGLSPFIIGPCELYGGHTARVFENAWQYAKAYATHIINGEPGPAYWAWAKEGWDNPRAVRYPMGRGAKPAYSRWEGENIGYIEARKRIYGPLYAEAVQKTAGWQRLVSLYETETRLVLRDFDGYDHDKKGIDLCGVLNNPRRKMGHAFVLKMLLTQDSALKQMAMRG